MNEYNLYDIYSYSNKSIEASLKVYGNLGISDLRILLIKKLLQEDLLDSLSKTIVSTGRFWELVFNRDLLLKSNYYVADKLYEIDLILLEVNTNEAKQLIRENGSDLAIKEISEKLLPDAMNYFVLSITDLDTLKQLYLSNKSIHDMLNNSRYLKDIARNMINKLNMLPRIVSPNYKRLEEDPWKIGDKINDINTFDDLIEWFETNFYTSNCAKYNEPVVCYSGAIDADDKIEVDSRLDFIRYLMTLDTVKNNITGIIAQLPIDKIISIFTNVDMDKNTQYEILYKTLQNIVLFYIGNAKLISSNDVTNLIALLDTIVDENNLYELLTSILPYPDLFIVLYKHLISIDYEVNMKELMKTSMERLKDRVYTSTWPEKILESLDRLNYDDKKVINKFIIFLLKDAILKPNTYKKIIIDIVKLVSKYIDPDTIIRTIKNIINDYSNESTFQSRIPFLKDIISKL